MFRTTACLAASVIVLGITLDAQNVRSPAVSQEQKPGEFFASQSAMAVMHDIELGKMAAQQGSNVRVKQFGHMMILDHTKTSEELGAIAKAKNMTLPTSLDTMHQATRDKLAMLNGAQFDRAYMDAMVTGHQTAENNMRTEADRGADPQLKAFAAKTIPMVLGHLKVALEIQKDLANPTK